MKMECHLFASLSINQKYSCEKNEGLNEHSIPNDHKQPLQNVTFFMISDVVMSSIISLTEAFLDNVLWRQACMATGCYMV